MNTMFYLQQMMKKHVNRLVLLTTLGFAALFYCHYQPFDNSDLGRHLMNGRLFIQQHQIIRTNTYSYTHPDFPVITHHWGSGVIFYLLKQHFGFIGLHLAVITLYLTSIILAARTSQLSSSSLTVLSLCFVLMAPLLGERNQIRPEVFTHFFLTIEIYLLELYRHHKLKPQLLLILPTLHLFWVNTHILFALGLLTQGIYWVWYCFIQPKKLQLRTFFNPLLLTFSLSVLISIINPWGIQGFLAPFNILQNYGFEISENQPVLEILNYFTQYKYIFYVIVCATTIILIKNYSHRRGVRQAFIPLVMMFCFGLFGFLMIRQISLFALIFIVYVPTIINDQLHGLSRLGKSIKILVVGATFVLIMLGTINQGSFFSPFRGGLGIGLPPHALDAGRFLASQSIHDPIFNNYDIGGYLIYFLYPQHRVYTDNRPEAYPASFFQNYFIPAQQDYSDWKKLDATFDFNTVILANSDITLRKNNFLLQRLSDPVWALVYQDQYVSTFVKRNSLNQALIDQYEVIP
jgi:hypothetical protein